MDNGATEREAKERQDFTQRLDRTNEGISFLSLCCGSFSICFLMSEEVSTEVMFAVDQDATGSMH